MHHMGPGILEIALRFRGAAFRVVYALHLWEEIWVVHAFQKKSRQGIKTPKHEIETDQASVEEIEGDVAMRGGREELVRGSGNVFHDLGCGNADILQFKAILAAEIIKALDREGLSVRGAQGRTGIAAADFSRIRNADLGRFTVDRLISIINRLGSRVEVKVKVRRVHTVETLAAAPG